MVEPQETKAKRKKLYCSYFWGADRLRKAHILERLYYSIPLILWSSGCKCLTPVHLAEASMISRWDIWGTEDSDITLRHDPWLNLGDHGSRGQQCTLPLTFSEPRWSCLTMTISWWPKEQDQQHFVHLPEAQKTLCHMMHGASSCNHQQKTFPKTGSKTPFSTV